MADERLKKNKERWTTRESKRACSHAPGDESKSSLWAPNDWSLKRKEGRRFKGEILNLMLEKEGDGWSRIALKVGVSSLSISWPSEAENPHTRPGSRRVSSSTILPPINSNKNIAGRGQTRAWMKWDTITPPEHRWKEEEHWPAAEGVRSGWLMGQMGREDKREECWPRIVPVAKAIFFLWGDEPSCGRGRWQWVRWLWLCEPIHQEGVSYYTTGRQFGSHTTKHVSSEGRWWWCNITRYHLHHGFRWEADINVMEMPLTVLERKADMDGSFISQKFYVSFLPMLLTNFNQRDIRGQRSTPRSDGSPPPSDSIK